MSTVPVPVPSWPDVWLWTAAHAAEPGTVARAATSPRASAWETLQAAGMSAETVERIAERACGSKVVDLSRVSAAAANLLPASVARRYGVVPVRISGTALEVAAANPLRHGLDQELAFAAGRHVSVHPAPPNEIVAALARVYEPAAPAPARTTPTSAPRTVVRPTNRTPTELPDNAIDVVDRILGEALRAGASDVHIEPRPTDLLVRFRVDGALYDALTVPERLGSAVTSRLKVTANLDIADRIRPQDGRATVMHEGRAVDLRVSTLPMGSGGEKVVVRLLDAGTAAHDLVALGFSAGELHRLQKLLALTEGLVLVTGPTGSGKTTTLYSALRHVQSSETNIVTVEDPVEYRIAGISQVQVSEKSGLTFASALRSILRQDPDVVLVGEIRDQETAAIGVKASMTGHLVLSTLHTNDAPSAVARLLDIGAEAGALAGALKGVVAQRLVRRLCPSCSQPVALADLPLDQQALLAGKPVAKLRRAVGCPECRSTGYRGRMTVAEVMTVSPDMQRAIARGADVPELASLARQHGMHTLWESGLARVLSGSTSLHELLDNITPPDAEVTASQSDVDALLAAIRPAAATVPAPHAAPAVSEPAPMRRRPTTGSFARISDGGAIRVLLVDDDRTARTAAREALERAGATVIEAADGEAALAYARRLSPHAIVADLALPRLDGIGLLQALRADGSRTAFHVATAQRDAALLDWARELGAAGVHPKAFDASAIVTAARPARSSAA